MSRIALYLHTVRYLKPVQIYGRAWLHLRRPRVQRGPTPPRAIPSGMWVEPAFRRPSLAAPHELHVLNRRINLRAHGWDDDALELLVRYNLHYFDDLAAPPTAVRLPWQSSLIEQWIHENPPGRGTGWAPYPTSLRIVNWIKWVMRGQAPSPAMLGSLAVQARWLARRFEVHLLGNHLLVNAKALVFAALFFDGPEADRWLVDGMRTLERELKEQILPDGAHFELSPMYHALALEDLLDLLNLFAAFPTRLSRYAGTVDEVRTHVGAMRRWLATMCHPDGEISFFNDAATGIAPTPAALEEYARRLPLDPVVGGGRVTHLRSSGYVRLALGDCVALLDVGRVGPDYLPAHAHADTLSFELSLFGHRVIVNSGTSQYGISPERQRQRETAAHSTVVVDGRSSSEVWAGFRVARRAYPRDLVVMPDTPIVVHCAHDGYRRLPGRPVHRRKWKLSPHDLVVEDQVQGGSYPAEARYHLHPSVDVATDAASAVATLRLPTGVAVTATIEQGRLEIVESQWHPEFGVAIASRCLAVGLVNGLSVVRLQWSGST